MSEFNYSSITQFQQHVDLKDYRLPTRKEYVRNLRKLAEHFQSDPATLTENQLREYFLFLRQHKGYKHSAMKAAKFALRSFYHQCLGQTTWTVFQELRIAEPDVLPIVLSRTEVQSLLGAITEARFRTCLRLMYHCGLRVGETVSIRLRDIHGRETPPRLHIRNGKGGKDRTSRSLRSSSRNCVNGGARTKIPFFSFPHPVAPGLIAA
jgi:integrase/recombinase XerD